MAGLVKTKEMTGELTFKRYVRVLKTDGKERVTRKAWEQACLQRKKIERKTKN